MSLVLKAKYLFLFISSRNEMLLSKLLLLFLFISPQNYLNNLKKHIYIIFTLKLFIHSVYFSLIKESHFFFTFLLPCFPVFNPRVTTSLGTKSKH